MISPALYGTSRGGVDSIERPAVSNPTFEGSCRPAFNLSVHDGSAAGIGDAGADGVGVGCTFAPEGKVESGRIGLTNAGEDVSRDGGSDFFAFLSGRNISDPAPTKRGARPFG